MSRVNVRRTPEIIEETAGESPSKALARQAAAPVVVVDSLKRGITMRRPPAIAQFRLVRALGESARNTAYVQMLLPLLYVVKIDEVDVHPPMSEREVEALIDLLETEGLSAIMQGMMDHFADGTSVAETQEAVKN